MISGFYLINKKENITSSDLVITLKKKLNLKKIGHTGTLDKFANGLMILPFGEFTAFSETFLHSDKEYIAEVEFGKSTDSGDRDGTILEEWNIEKINQFYFDNQALIKAEILKIKETEIQIAPKVSALKIGGIRQSELFRQNISFEEKKRNIKIYELEFENLSELGFNLKVKVSSGTYIRKLVMDLSEKLNLPMYVKNLKRTKIANFKIEDSFTIEEILDNRENYFGLEQMLPIPIVQTNLRDRILNGAQIKLDIIPNEFLIIDQEGFLLAWCDKQNEKLYNYKKVFQGKTNIPFQGSVKK